MRKVEGREDIPRLPHAEFSLTIEARRLGLAPKAAEADDWIMCIEGLKGLLW